MKVKLLHICVVFFLATTAWAQQPPGSNPDPIGQNFFPPELVMQNQESIGLSEEQKAFLKTELREAQSKFTDWQWKLQDEVEKMVSLIKQPHIDEQQVLAQLEKVLATEREVKRAQISLLVHIKNKLSAEQQAKLEAIRNRR